MGLSHGEAVNWTESHSPIIDALVEQDQPFADELKKCRAMSRLLYIVASMSLMLEQVNA